jgi:predicted nucleotide-binding protein (sugar kinase/HSP70/actin superfamily)
LKTRPYELHAGDTDRTYEETLTRLETLLAEPSVPFRKRFRSIAEELRQARERFKGVPADYVKGKPLIAVVGEIFCRHNRFANENILRTLEAHGAETWLADVGEWVIYTDWSRLDNLRRRGKRWSLETLGTKIKLMVMKHDEHRLLHPFHDDFVGYEEPASTDVIAQFAEPYLPLNRALGEMALSLGRSGYSYERGVDGIVDISPFSCMNGIVSEAVYPSFSRDHNDIPCRVFYFDGVNADIDRDIGIFMELVRGYMNRKHTKRTYPAFFRDA